MITSIRSVVAGIGVMTIVIFAVGLLFQFNILPNTLWNLMLAYAPAGGIGSYLGDHCTTSRRKIAAAAVGVLVLVAYTISYM